MSLFKIYIGDNCIHVIYTAVYISVTSTDFTINVGVVYLFFKFFVLSNLWSYQASTPMMLLYIERHENQRLHLWDRTSLHKYIYHRKAKNSFISIDLYIIHVCYNLQINTWTIPFQIHMYSKSSARTGLKLFISNL